ncbi:MAG: S-methyl-5-thioribose-1-phosphate isomerase [Deltaproteobacteria bacterium]|nr:S-methyl-5-thioribose-1-phosphate isomerase [Deltaproteobacteria bacterium]
MPTAIHRALWDEVQSPLFWDDGRVVLLDQRRLPLEEVWLAYDDADGVAGAIREMVVRGAPAIGCAAAMGLAASARSALPDDVGRFRAGFSALCERMARARPTAVNLMWAVARQQRVAEAALASGGVAEARHLLEREALAITREDLEACRVMGRHGAELIPEGAGVLTHCNAGALATAGYGTALGVIRAAVAAGKRLRVFADETRPYLQGARLTAWELQRDGIDVTLICDNMAADLMRRGEIQCCVVGADRVTRNGDVANKIGTYGVAVLAHHHELPFYVAAPRSTIDLTLTSGEQIPIEERPADEVTHVGSVRIAPEHVKVRYPAFDVTPARLIRALVTEAGVALPPEVASIQALFA